MTMDIFNRKRVEELEEELDRTKRELLMAIKERDGLSREYTLLREELEAAVQLKDAIPENCTPGSYCRACEFSRPLYHYDSRSPLGRGWLEGHICNKAQSCANFIQKDTSRN